MSGYTILLIDDDETTHDVLGDYLKLSGYQVLRADNGRQGLEMIADQRPDLVLMDVQMPELDGFQALEMARRRPELADIPILLITSLDRYNLKVKGLELGAEDYIVKPFNRTELLARVKVALRRCQRYRHLDNILGGNLQDVTLAELFQTMEMGRKTAVISLPDILATIYLEDGIIVRAEQGLFTGKEALLRIMFLEQGAFAVKFGPLPEGLSREPVPISHLLLDALTYLDELACIMAKLPPAHSLVEQLSPASPCAAAGIGQLLPLPLRDFVVRLPGDLKENALRTTQAIAGGEIMLANYQV